MCNAECRTSTPGLSPVRDDSGSPSAVSSLGLSLLVTPSVIGGMADLKSGKFKDSAGGIMSYLGVDEAWDERTVEGMER